MFFKRTHFEFVGGYAHIPKTLTFWGFLLSKSPQNGGTSLYRTGGGCFSTPSPPAAGTRYCLPRHFTAILLMAVKVEFLFKCHSRAGLPAVRQLAGIYIKRPFYRFRVKHGMTI
jgi:hypothetical protein